MSSKGTGEVYKAAGRRKAPAASAMRASDGTPRGAAHD